VPALAAVVFREVVLPGSERDYLVVLEALRLGWIRLADLELCRRSLLQRPDASPLPEILESRGYLSAEQVRDLSASVGLELAERNRLAARLSERKLVEGAAVDARNAPMRGLAHRDFIDREHLEPPVEL